MDLNLENGFTKAAVNALDIGLFQDYVALRIGMEDGSVYEKYLNPAEAINLAQALMSAARIAQEFPR